MIDGKKIVEMAVPELGYKEIPAGSNKTKYGKWFGFDGVAWCAMFVSWVYDRAGFPLGNIGFTKGFAGCQSGFDFFKKKGWIIPSSQAQPGDIVLFDWNGDKRYDHTGIFVSHDGGDKFISIEGNTAIGNDSNGGEVMKRTRSYSKAIFIHPQI